MTRGKIPVQDNTGEHNPVNVRAIEWSISVEDYFGEMEFFTEVPNANIEVAPVVVANSVLVKSFVDGLRRIESGSLAREGWQISAMAIHHQPRTPDELHDVRVAVEELRERVTKLEAREALDTRKKVSIEVARAMAKLVSVYQVPDDIALAEHIEEYDTQPDALIEAALELRERFGDGVRLQLRRQDGFMLLVIRTGLHAVEAEQLRSKFLDEWWLVNEKVDEAIVVALDWA